MSVFVPKYEKTFLLEADLYNLNTVTKVFSAIQ